MDKKIFTAGVKATATDFNDLHDNTEDAIGVLVKAVASAGTTSAVFFENKPPTISGGGPYTIIVPAQYIALNGVVAYLPATTLPATSVFPNTVYFAIRRSNVTGTRDTLTAAGQTVVVEKVASAVAFLGNDAPARLGGTAPATLPEDVAAPVEFAYYANPATLDHDYNNYLWTITAAGLSPHASTHLSGGSDALPVASSLVPSGLVDWLSLQSARAAVNAINISVGSPFLTASTSGSYTTTPKTTTLAVSVDGDTFDASSPLGLKFPNGPLMGTSKQPARSDHRHGLDASPIVVYQTEIPVEISWPLGSAKTLTLPSSAGTVASVSIFWKPASAVSTTNFPLVPTLPHPVQYGTSLYNVGAWGTLLAGNIVRINFGTDGICFLSENDYKTASGVFASVTWQSAISTDGRVPTSGILVVRVTAVRDYVTPLTV